MPLRARVLGTLIVGCAVAVLATNSIAATAARTTATAAKANSSGSASAGSYSEASRIARLAETTGVFGAGSGNIAPQNVSAPAASLIKAVPFKPGSLKKTVAIVPCTPTGSCTQDAILMAQIFKKLGLKAKVVPSLSYAPASFQTAWNAALAGHPAAIIGIGTVGAAIGPQLAQAKSDGIYTVFVNGTTLSGAGYDAYIPGGWNLGQIASIAQVIASDKGKSHIVSVVAPEFPDLGVTEGLKFLEAACRQCTIVHATYTAALAVNPVQFGQWTTGLIEQNPNLNYIDTVSADEDVEAAASAIKSSTQPNVKLIAPGLTVAAAEDVRNGDMPFTAGPPLEWVSLQAVDAVLRGLLHKPAVSPAKRTIGVLLLTKSAIPRALTGNNSGPLDRWALTKFNFLAPYEEAWKTNLTSIARNES